MWEDRARGTARERSPAHRPDQAHQEPPQANAAPAPTTPPRRTPAAPRPSADCSRDLPLGPVAEHPSPLPGKLVPGRQYGRTPHEPHGRSPDPGGGARVGGCPGARMGGGCGGRLCGGYVVGGGVGSRGGGLGVGWLGVRKATERGRGCETLHARGPSRGRRVRHRSTRTTPARAGTTGGDTARQWPARDHPRTRRDHGADPNRELDALGPLPRTRGPQHWAQHGHRLCGTTPAHAGTTVALGA